MAMIMRNIWYRRNKFMFDKKFLTPTSVVQLSLVGYEDFKLAQEMLRGEINKVAVNPTMCGGKGWRKPGHSKLKVNFDAAINVSSQRLGIGLVIRDCEHEVFAAKCAIKEAMVLCEDLGLGDVQFERDAKGVIDAVRKGEMDDSKAGHQVEALQQKLSSYSRWKVSFTHREDNEDAHQLAKMALNYEKDIYWIKEGLESIVNQLIIDQMYVVSDTS
ncbi:uncharacterized protein LOC122278450 [Carya illinoinensis]|uniref:uncharacterized protein LOC122278450 n=1 Tax=Carya illinoinensis TaxID=32201 RepID=UPI001C719BB4|nr:uncharacterized protein LOC122278450 [Carya illinoinensis]